MPANVPLLCALHCHVDRLSQRPSPSALQGAGLPLAAGLFAPAEEAPAAGARSGAGRAANASFKFNSVASQFKKQLAELMAALNAMEPHYIRCIKPSATPKPKAFDDCYALNQLKCGGVMEAIRISCAGGSVLQSWLVRASLCTWCMLVVR